MQTAELRAVAAPEKPSLHQYRNLGRVGQSNRSREERWNWTPSRPARQL